MSAAPSSTATPPERRTVLVTGAGKRLGREIALAPKVMVLAQPTWGVDIGAAMLIRQAIIDLRDQGVAVLVLSEEIDELFMMSDRIAVLAKGRLSRAVPSQDFAGDY
eukprot:gene27172-30715_t